jgi:hypothetical protein
MRLAKHSGVFLFLAFVSFAQAQYTLPSSLKKLSLEEFFRNSNRSAYEELQSLGYEKIGSRPISEIIKQSAKVRWIEVQNYPVGGRDKDRLSASGNFDTKTVSVGTPFAQAYTRSSLDDKKHAITIQALRIWGLHEDLFMSGVEDEQYDTSLVLGFSTFLKDDVIESSIRDIFDLHLLRVATHKVNPLLAGGRGGGASGGSGVNGGGDIAALDFKYMFLAGLLVPNTELRKTLQMIGVSVEDAVRSALQTEVTVSYTDSLYSVGRNADGKFVVTLTHDLWFNQNARAQWVYRVRVMHILMNAMAKETNRPAGLVLSENVEDELRQILTFKLKVPELNLSQKEIAEKMDHLKIEFVKDGSYRVSQMKDGSFRIRVSKNEWADNRKTYFNVVCMVAAFAMGNHNYAQYMPKTK